MAEKIEGYRERGSAYEEKRPKETSKEMRMSTPVQGPSMTSTIEEHIKTITNGRSGVPDSNKKKAQ